MKHYNVTFPTQIYSSYSFSSGFFRFSTSTNTRASTPLCQRQSHPFLFRSMIGRNCIQAARAAYHFASIVTSTDSLRESEGNKIQPFIKDVLKYALDPNQGTPQHKGIFVKTISNQTYPSNDFMKEFCEQTKSDNITWPENVFVDWRILSEFSCLDYYKKHNSDTIDHIYVTLDTPQDKLELFKANQSNPDYIVTTKNKKNMVDYIDQMLGLKKITYQDEKTGRGILRHSTKGTIGLLPFDSKGQSIQVCSDIITPEDIFLYNKKERIPGISESLKDDNIYETFSSVILKAKGLIGKLDNNDFTKFEEVKAMHDDLNELLWYEMQINPLCKRSLAFPYMTQMINYPETEKERLFSNIFRSNLTTYGVYNVHKRGQFNELYRAFIIAGKAIDPDFVQKLYYLHKEGFTLNDNLLFLLKTLNKNDFS